MGHRHDLKMLEEWRKEIERDYIRNEIPKATRDICHTFIESQKHYILYRELVERGNEDR